MKTKRLRSPHETHMRCLMPRITHNTMHCLFWKDDILMPKIKRFSNISFHYLNCDTIPKQSRVKSLWSNWHNYLSKSRKTNILDCVQRWIFKPFSDAAAEVTLKVAVFKYWFSGWSLDHFRITWESPASIIYRVRWFFSDSLRDSGKWFKAPCFLDSSGSGSGIIIQRSSSAVCD